MYIMRNDMVAEWGGWGLWLMGGRMKIEGAGNIKYGEDLFKKVKCLKTIFVGK